MEWKVFLAIHEYCKARGIMANDRETLERVIEAMIAEGIIEKSDNK